MTLSRILGILKLYLKNPKQSHLPTSESLLSGTISEKSNEVIWRKVQK